MNPRYDEHDDDERVIADMSEVTRTPVLMPRFDMPERKRRDNGAEAEPSGRSNPYQQPVQLDSEERRAVIGGAVSAALLIGGVIALAFAGLIFLILHIYG